MSDLDEFLNSLPLMGNKGYLITPEETKKRYEKNSKLDYEARKELIDYLKDERTPPPPEGITVEAIAVDHNGVELFNGKYRFNQVLRVLLDVEPKWAKDYLNSSDPIAELSIHTLHFYYDPVVTARFNRNHKTSSTVYIFVGKEK